MKRCTACGISKNVESFGKQKQPSGNYTRRAECSACRTEDSKKRYQNESEEQKTRRRNKFLIKSYGIDISRYNELFIQQKGCCLGCGRHQSELDKALVVDHDHKTLTVRGLLCLGCNLAVGNAKDNPKTLISLAGYLERHQ